MTPLSPDLVALDRRLGAARPVLPPLDDACERVRKRVMAAINQVAPDSELETGLQISGASPPARPGDALAPSGQTG